MTFGDRFCFSRKGGIGTAWLSLGSALETPWLALGGPLLSSYAWTGCSLTLHGSHFRWESLFPSLGE